MQFTKLISTLILIAVVTIWSLFLLAGIALSSCSQSTVSIGDVMEALGTLFVGLTVAAAIMAYLNQEESLNTAKGVAYRQLIADQLKERPIFRAQVKIRESTSDRLMNPIYTIAIINISSDLYNVTLSGCKNEFGHAAFLNIMPKNARIEIRLDIITPSSNEKPIVAHPRIEYLNAIGERHECEFEVSFFSSQPRGWSDAKLKIKHSDIIGHVSKIDPAVYISDGS